LTNEQLFIGRCIGLLSIFRPGHGMGAAMSTMGCAFTSHVTSWSRDGWLPAIKKF